MGERRTPASRITGLLGVLAGLVGPFLARSALRRPEAGTISPRMRTSVGLLTAAVFLWSLLAALMPVRHFGAA